MAVERPGPGPLEDSLAAVDREFLGERRDQPEVVPVLGRARLLDGGRWVYSSVFLLV